MLRIGILATHPIQYHVPLFKQLASSQDVSIHVYFCHKPTPSEQGEGFGVSFQWDIDLTAGYDHTWLSNRSLRPSLQSFWGCNTPEIREIIRKNRFDAFMVHGWYNLSCWQAFQACWSTGTPLLVRSDSQLNAQKSTLKKMAKDLAYPKFFGRYDVCLPYGKRSAEYFEHFGGRQIVVAPHFVDNDWFAERAGTAIRHRKDIRNKWGIHEDAFVFLFAGKFEQKKRPTDIVNAIARLIGKRAGNTALLMVGHGLLRSACEQMARDLTLPIYFAGFLNQTEIPAAYAASDCLVLASDGGETWGLVVNEAMACGLSAIVSDACGCVPDLIVEGQTGFSYPCGDVEMLAELMERISSEPGLCKRMGKAAHRHIQNFSAERAAEIIVAESSKLKGERPVLSSWF